MAADDWDYLVRHRAYELWNEAGRPNGQHLQFWEAAERELTKALVQNGAVDAPDADMLNGKPKRGIDKH